MRTQEEVSGEAPDAEDAPASPLGRRRRRGGARRGRRPRRRGAARRRVRARIVTDRRRGRRRRRREPGVAEVLRDQDVRRAGQVRAPDRDRRGAHDRRRDRGSGGVAAAAPRHRRVRGARGDRRGRRRHPARERPDRRDPLDRGRRRRRVDVPDAPGGGRAADGRRRRRARRRPRSGATTGGGSCRRASRRRASPSWPAVSDDSSPVVRPPRTREPPRRSPRRRSPGRRTPAGADLGVPGVGPFLTPNPDFYRVDTALFVPAIDAETWTLRVHGMVDRELTLDFDELLARPMIERDVTIACVSNEVGGRYVGNARWIGAPLADLLREAGVHADASQIVSRSADGFTIGTPTAVVDGRPGRDARRLDERRAPPLGARVPGPDDRAGPLRLRLGDEVAGRPRAHDARCLRRVLDPAGLGEGGTGQDAVEDRHARLRSDARSRRRPRGGGRVGAAPRHRPCRGAGRRRPVGRRPTSEPRTPSTHGGSGCTDGTRRPGRTPWRSGRRTATARRRPPIASLRSRTARPAITRSLSRSPRRVAGRLASVVLPPSSAPPSSSAPVPSSSDPASITRKFASSATSTTLPSSRRISTP